MEYHFPEITTAGRVVIRYFSDINAWLDFIVAVQPEDWYTAREMIRRAMDEFWNQSDECYGDLVERYLANAKIDYEIVYHDSEREDDAYEAAWEEYVDSLRQDAKYAQSMLNEEEMVPEFVFAVTRTQTGTIYVKAETLEDAKDIAETVCALGGDRNEGYVQWDPFPDDDISFIETRTVFE